MTIPQQGKTMESEEDGKDKTVVRVQPTPGQRVYTKRVQISQGNSPAIDKLVKLGVLVSLDKGTSDHEVPTPASNAEALPSNVNVSDLPENMTLETEFYESENRKIMRMRLKPEPNSLLKPEALRFKFLCNYTRDQGRDGQLALPDVGQADEAKSVSSGEAEAETEYFSDVDIEESEPNEKGVQTDIALGELLFSDSITSTSHAEVESVTVQTYITAINVSHAGEEGAEHEVEIEETLEPRDDEEENGGRACEEEEEEDEKDEEKEEEEEEGEEEEEEVKEDVECVDDVEEPIEEPQEACEEAKATGATSPESPSGIPLCLLRGDPPWVDPLVDTYTVMWDTNLEVAPKDVGIQFVDTVDPTFSGTKLPEMDPFQQMRRSQALSAAFTVKVVSSDQSYFGSFMAASASGSTLKRDPELFNIHIDLNTWGFPAALHERYAKSATTSVSTLFDNQPSLGEILYMNKENTSIHSVYNPSSMAEDPTDKLSVGFIPEEAKGSSDIRHESPQTKAVHAPEEEQQKEEVKEETPDVTENMRASGVSIVESESPKGPRSVSEEYFSTVEELQSSAHSSSEHLKEDEEEVRVPPTLPLALVIAINDSRPLILLLDPEDLPISIAIGTKNVPVNNASAACAIRKIDGNRFHINNIDLRETAITNLELEKTESDKVKCNIKIEGDVKGQTIADLGTLGSPLLLNLPLEQAGTSRNEPMQCDAEEEKERLIAEGTTLPDKEFTEGVELDISVETEKDAFELQWQEGLPVSEDISPHRTDTVCMDTVSITEAQIDPRIRNEDLRSFEEEKVAQKPERMKHKSGFICKTSCFDKLSHSTPQPPSNKPPTKLNYGVLSKSLKDLERQISPLNKALDDIKCKIQALEFEDPDILLSPVCSEGSSILSRSDSGYEQEIAELISSAQREAMTATSPCTHSSSSHIQCMCDPSTELLSPRRRKSYLRRDSCSMGGYMVQQRAVYNTPLSMGITYLVPTPIEMVTPTTWQHSSLYRTPSELGCLGGCVSSPTEKFAPRRTRTSCSRWTSEL